MGARGTTRTGSSRASLGTSPRPQGRQLASPTIDECWDKFRVIRRVPESCPHPPVFYQQGNSILTCISPHSLPVRREKQSSLKQKKLRNGHHLTKNCVLPLRCHLSRCAYRCAFGGTRWMIVCSRCHFQRRRLQCHRHQRHRLQRL